MNKTMDEQPGEHISRRARHWRTALLWAAALAALALAAWIVTFGTYPMNG